MNLVEIRKELILKRKELTSEYVELKSSLMTEDIINDKHYIESDVIYVYLPKNNEISTEKLIVKALKSNKTVAVPVVLTSGDMVFEKIDDLQSFHYNRYHILEPKYDAKLIVDKQGLMLVPLVGFYGNKRIGYGGQYYNNYLTNRRNLYTIGIGYSFQEIEELPYDERDIPLNEIRTY